MLADRAAQRCARLKLRRLALFGVGPNARRYIRQPWQWRGLEVVACLAPPESAQPLASIEGVPVFGLAEWERLRSGIDGVIVCSDADEPAAFATLSARIGEDRAIIRPFEPAAPSHEPGEAGRAAVISRLRARGVAEAHARWLADNRMERHDALLGTLPPERTELHLRRYWLASRFANGARVLDAACGTGYGSAVLGQSAAGVLGLDIDPAAIDFARAYHASAGVRFETADARRTPCLDRSVDLITSFETIEHLSDPSALIDEFARVLRVGGVLVLSTPNDGGLTAFHEQSLTIDDLDRLLSPGFLVTHRLGQRAGNDPVSGDLPPGFFPLGASEFAAETLLVIATRR